MRSIGLTRAGILLPIVTFLGRVGAPADRLLARAGLPEWILTDPETPMPTVATVRLLTAAARLEGIETVGLLAGEETGIEMLGAYGRLVRSNPTLGGALEALVLHHATFSSNGRMWLAPHAEGVEVCQAFGNRFDESWQQASHYILMLMVGVIRLGAGPTWRPAAVKLQTRECAALRDAEILSSVHLEFAQPATSIVVPRALLEKPLPSFALGLPGGIDAWNASAPARDFLGSVTQVIESLARESYPTIHATADCLGMSVRTLQRHLAAAGHTHEDLIGRSRCATATALLEQTDSKIVDVALDVGYSDHAHFTRAFRRWTGSSPQEFRRRRRTPQ